MKVVLILAPFDQLKAAGFKSVMVKRVYGYSVPLGIAYLAAMLEQAGHDVSVLDPCPDKLSINEIVDWILSQRPDVLGISTLTHMSQQAYHLANEAKRRMPMVPIMLGGAHCTSFPETVMPECPNIDVVVIGEAEERIVPLVEALHQGDSLDFIPGLIFKDAKTGRIRDTGAPQQVRDLDSLPFPARLLFDHSKYNPFPDQVRKSPVTNLITSRGCSWRKCKFCFEGGKYMPQYRRRSPENVIEELTTVKKQGFEGVAIWDDNFCVSEKWISKFCKLLRESRLNLTWSCYGRVDQITEQMICDISSAGCFSIYFGFESGDQSVLDFIQKGTTLDQARKAISACRRAKIELRGSFIFGMPGDTPELAKKSIRFARELDLDFVKFMLYTPEQGTELYEAAMACGRIVNEGFLGSLTRATYVPKGYESVEQLEEIALRANRSYVFRPAFVWRKMKSIRSWQDICKYFDGLLLMISLRRS
jgi:anaerobic magnesium-protoporphyrin IX monomethyl ester cyclase